MAQVKLSDLIAQAEKRKEQKKVRKQLYIKSLDGEITVEKPSRALCLDALDMGSNEGDAYLVYECVVEPSLKNPELQAAYGCTQPLEIVDKIFEPGEVAQIAKTLVEMAGYGDGAVKVVEDLKN
ncbi:MAG: phage portal protein [Moorella sp. (in: firmicutes)]